MTFMKKENPSSEALPTQEKFFSTEKLRRAARVQDNLDGQATVVARIEVSETDCRIIEEKIVNL